jgi:drug/metabolite transporter (DMT)-like permease
MRRAIFWTGWSILFLIPVAFVAEALWFQDMPPFPQWKFVVPVVAFALIVLGRNRDDVLKHHLA